MSHRDVARSQVRSRVILEQLPEQEMAEDTLI